MCGMKNTKYAQVIKQKQYQSHAEKINVLHGLKEGHSYCYEHMSYFAYACKTKGKNGISRLISGLCVNCLSSIQ